MSRRCSNTKCTKHHIRLKGLTKYCPACGCRYPCFSFLYLGLKWVAAAEQIDVLLNVFPRNEQEALEIISPYLSE